MQTTLLQLIFCFFLYILICVLKCSRVKRPKFQHTAKTRAFFELTINVTISGMFPVLWQVSPALVVIPSVHFYSIFFPGGRLSRISLISDFYFCSKNTCWLAMSPMAFAAVEPTMSPSSERISSLRSCKRIHEIVSPKRCGSLP